MKLTAERARFYHEQLSMWKADNGISLREDAFLQALAKAIPVLEREEAEGREDAETPSR